MEIIKQLYDIARLFEITENLETTAKSFERIAEVELSPTLPSRLNKLKRTSPEAYFYWAKTSQLL